MPTITIDGKTVEFNQGQTIIEVARNNGADIPHFCWHPKLSVSGNCRVCLVEVEKMPKLVISCATLATEGMVVHTKSPKTLEARNAVMEFILINHPLDCPICDEAGECKLQDYAYEHSRGESRFEEIKNRKEKRVQLGTHVKFDGDRCISCSRCIRFSDEIAKANQLTFVQRGDRVTITTFPGESFDNPYSLNVVDICPVGALTNQDFRFKSRVWEMSSTNSICVGCSRGCNTEVWVRNNQILRLTPRHNEDVNSYWMCDHGRLDTFKNVNSDTRIDGAFIRAEGQLNKTDWNNAFTAAARELKKYKSGEIAFIGSAMATCEDNFVLAKFAKMLGVANIGLASHVVPGSGDDILIREDKSPNYLGAELTGIKPGNGGMNLDGIQRAIKEQKIKAAFILDDDIASINDEWEQALGKLDLLIVAAVNQNKTTALADILLGASSFAEKHGTFVNFQGRVQRIKSAVATEEMDRALDGMNMSRWDKFGTKYDRWMNGHKYSAYPGWEIISYVANSMNAKFKYEMAEDVFHEMANNLDAFKGLDYDKIGDLGFVLKIKQNVGV